MAKKTGIIVIFENIPSHLFCLVSLLLVEAVVVVVAAGLVVVVVVELEGFKGKEYTLC